MPGFDSVSSEYSFLRKTDFAKVFVQHPFLFDLINPKVGERILDIGCGDGVLSIGLVKRGAIVTGFDSSPDQIKLARLNFVGLNGIDFGVFSQDSFVSSINFDKALISMVLMYAPSERGVLKFFEVAFKSLKKGGFLYLLDLDKEKVWFGESHLSRAFKKNLDGSSELTFLPGSEHAFSVKFFGYSEEQLIALARKAGFSLVSVVPLKIPAISKSKVSDSFVLEFNNYPLWFAAVFQK